MPDISQAIFFLNIQTFIFDLGGVIIDLDEHATISAFSKMTNVPAPVIFDKISNSATFKLYEKGLITDWQFRMEVNNLFESSASDDRIDEAWNAMLGNIPAERLELLLELKKDHKVIILSNTNAIHENAFNQILKKASGKDSLTSFADHVFFSHRLGMRKPDAEIYQEILHQSNTDPTLALFMDDKQENLNSAESVGIKTMHISFPDQIFELKKYVQR